MMRLVLVLLAAGGAIAQSPEPKTTFQVKYVAEGAVYLDAGRNAGLAEGMRLSIRRGQFAAAAELEIVSVAESSAVCELKSALQEIRQGDEAVLSNADAEKIREARSFSGGRKYAQIVTFTEGDPLEEEARASVPRPPLPEVNRARGRIGFEYSTIRDREGMTSQQTGLVFRGDMTRIAGSYWNLSGYWRGRLNSRHSGLQDQTLTDLLNRTYHLTLYYNNPASPYRIGAGRLYLPWAASLETIDGGYFGRLVAKGTTAGVFAGSTPDPTSWNYNPGRQIFGSFVNYEGGQFENLHYTSTGGYGVSRLNWEPERKFVFFETSVLYKRYLSVYHNLEADRMDRPDLRTDMGLARSFLTLRVQPVPYLTVDFSHNYFRDVPTFDPRLVGTGLVDRLLFQGLSAGVRAELPYRVTVYTNLGRSDRSGDAQKSWNQMYGIMVSNIGGTGVRADTRYSRFDSAFGRGTYASLNLTREFGENLRVDFQTGRQNFVSTFTAANNAKFITGSVDWFLSRHYFAGGGLTIYRGHVQNYEQIYCNLGYRF